MRKLLLLLLISFACFGAPRTVSGPLQNPSNGGANGTVTVEWQTFTAGDGSLIPAGTRVTTVSGGTYSQTFEPTSDASPSGVTYKVTYRFGSASPSVCYWVLPSGSGSVLIANIQTCSPPSAPAGTVALSQLSIGGGSNGQCAIITAGVWAPNTCTFNWTTNGNDIYNSNTGNIGIGATPGNYKLDISKSSSTGSLQVFDQTVTTGSTFINVQAGAGQSTNPLANFTLNNGTIIGQVGNDGAFNQYLSGLRKTLHFQNLFGLSSDSGIYWGTTTSWTGTTDVSILRDSASKLVLNGNFKITGLGGAGSKYVCVDNSGNLSMGSTC